MFAFEGLSAFFGQSPATKIHIQISFQDGVAADIYEFNSIGAFLGSTATKTAMVYLREQKNFFSPYQRQVPYEVGRTYTVLENMIGHFVKKTNKSGGVDGYLLLLTFSKQVKPPNNVPSVNNKYSLLVSFDTIQTVRKKGYLINARAVWEKYSVLLSKYFLDV